MSQTQRGACARFSVVAIAHFCFITSYSFATPQSSAATSQPSNSFNTQRIYSGFGNYSRTITTNSPEAQKWFNQGIQLLYGFNHDEAIRSFQQAAKLDPRCAMAWWGVSYANGLHINNPVMTEQQTRNGYDAAQEALKRIDHANPAEKALIHAVAKRYALPAPEDRKLLDEAYAQAMAQAWAVHPNDPDIGALYAESLMDLQPWDYWTYDGQPKGKIDEIVSTLEASMAISPNHPGANHFYIHAVEASSSPHRAEKSANLLLDLVPGSGHLVHMPSHIFIRTGRYAEAADTNERAIKVDDEYLAIAPPPTFYRIYFIHNMHFLAYAAMMEGRYETALGAARRIESKVPLEFLQEFAKLADAFMPTTMHVMIRFGKWDEILKEPAPPEFRLVSRAMRHYARGIALSALGRTDEAHEELKAFDEVAAQITDEWFIGNNPAQTILPMARLMLEGELRYREGQTDKAFALLREAIAMEDRLVYDEPPGWMQPVRHALGALLMGEGKAVEAEAVYREDLEENAENGWSLLGLREALLKQNRKDEGHAVDQRLKKAWTRADVKPTSSCYCQPSAR